MLTEITSSCTLLSSAPFISAASRGDDMDDDLALFVQEFGYTPDLSLLEIDHFCVGADAPCAIEKQCQEIPSETSSTSFKSQSSNESSNELMFSFDEDLLAGNADLTIPDSPVASFERSLAASDAEAVNQPFGEWAPVVAEEEPIHCGTAFDNKLYPLIENFRRSIFSADRLCEFQSARAWSSEATCAYNTDLLGDLILGLSNRLRLLYPFIRANGRAEVDVVDAARVIGLALYSKLLGPTSEWQRAVVDAACAFHDSLLRVMDLAIVSAGIYTGQELTIDDADPAEVSFEHDLRTALRMYGEWAPATVRALAKGYEARLENMMHAANKLDHVQPRLARYALDDIAKLMPDATRVLKDDQIDALAASAFTRRSKYSSTPMPVRSASDVHTYRTLLMGETGFEMMYELGVDEAWVFDRITTPYHPYASVTAGKELVCEYQNSLPERIPMSTWGSLRVKLVASESLTPDEDTCLESAIRTVAYILPRLAINAPSRLPLMDVVMPAQFKGRILARTATLVADCALVWEACADVFTKHLAADVYAYLAGYVSTAAAFKATDQDQIVSYAMYFLSQLHTVVVDAHNAMMAGMFEVARGSYPTHADRLDTLRMWAMAKCVRGYLDLPSTAPVETLPSVPPADIAARFFSASLVHARRALVDMPLSAYRSLVDESNPVALGEVFARMLLRSLRTTNCSHLSPTFPEIYILDDTRLIYASQEIHYLACAALVAGQLYQAQGNVPVDACRLLDEADSVDELLKQLGPVAAPLARKGIDVKKGPQFVEMYTRMEKLFVSCVLSQPTAITKNGCPGQQAVGLRSALVMWPRMQRCVDLLRMVNATTMAVYMQFMAPAIRAEAKARLNASAEAPVPEPRKRRNVGA